MGRTRPPYPPEFRQEAIRLVGTDGHRSVSEIAREIGISSQTLRNWVGQARIDAGQAEGLPSDELQELRRLRRENRLLREEKEILRKAAAFFARESDQSR